MTIEEIENNWLDAADIDCIAIAHWATFYVPLLLEVAKEAKEVVEYGEGTVSLRVAIRELEGVIQELES